MSASISACIITCHDVYNSGASLQAYGTFCSLILYKLTNCVPKRLKLGFNSLKNILKVSFHIYQPTQYGFIYGTLR